MSPELLEIRRERMRMLAESLAEETGIPVACILGRERDPQVVAVRHRLWRMLVDTGLSVSAVGQIVGCDHTSVRAALRKPTPIVTPTATPPVSSEFLARGFIARSQRRRARRAPQGRT